MNFNKVILGGRLTRDVEVKDLGNDSKVAKFTIASSRPFTGRDGEKKEDVIFMDCELWGTRVDVLEKYTAKGHSLLVEGKLKQDNWENDAGEKRSRIVLRVDDFQFVGGQKPESAEDGGQKGSGPVRKPASTAGKPTKVGGKAGKDDDIPF